VASDTQAPTLVTIGRDKSTLNIDGGQTIVVVTAQLTDSLSGVSDGLDGTASQIRFLSPSGQFVDGIFDSPSTGTSQNGTFNASLTFGPYAEAGTWSVEYLLLADEAGNISYLYPDTTSSLQSLSFDVANSNSDATPPNLASISRNDSVIDINAGESQQIVTARFTDDKSGLFDIEHPVSGTRTDGVYKATLTFDSSAEAGQWTVEYLLLNDEAGNLKYLYPDSTPALNALAFQVENATGDSEPPTVQSVTFGSPTLNPDGTSQFIVEAHLLDNLSGLSGPGHGFLRQPTAVN